MSESIKELLQGIAVLEPSAAHGLQVFGLRREPSPAPLEYLTLDEALEKKLAEVTEVSEGGSVPVLKVVNRANAMLFLLAGEQLIGAKQNRVLNASIMVAANTELPVPVSCVEQGRWSYRTKHFGTSGTATHHGLRKMMHKETMASLAHTGEFDANQGAVWREVSRKLASHGSQSASAALEQVYMDHQKDLASLLKQLSVPEGCVGAVFAFGGRIAGLEMFDQPKTLARLWSKLIRSYAIDALEANQPDKAVSQKDVEKWLNAAKKLKAKSYKSPGLGDDIRVEGKEMTGATLVVEKQPVHVELFADAPMPGKA